MKSRAVEIVLSTYNGEKFLREQLLSLQAQDYPHWRLWIRDDGSTDKTLGIIESFIKNDSRIRWSSSQQEGKNLGAPQSFHALLKTLPKDCELFLPCDQDDVWEKNKISTLLKIYHEEKEGNGKPFLIFSDMKLIDYKGEILFPSQMDFMAFTPRTHLNGIHLAAQNMIAGCSLMGNQALLEKALPIPPEALMHDWWLALVAAFIGKVVYTPETLVQYRQHSLNASGGSQRKGVGTALKLLNSKSENSFLNLMTGRYRQVVLLRKHLERLGYKNEKLDQLLLSLQDSRFQRVLKCLELGFLPQGLERRMLFLALLFGWKAPQLHEDLRS